MIKKYVTLLIILSAMIFGASSQSFASAIEAVRVNTIRLEQALLLGDWDNIPHFTIANADIIMHGSTEESKIEAKPQYRNHDLGGIVKKHFGISTTRVANDDEKATIYKALDLIAYVRQLSNLVDLNEFLDETFISPDTTNKHRQLAQAHYNSASDRLSTSSIVALMKAASESTLYDESIPYELSAYNGNIHVHDVQPITDLKGEPNYLKTEHHWLGNIYVADDKKAELAAKTAGINLRAPATVVNVAVEYIKDHQSEAFTAIANNLVFPEGAGNSEEVNQSVLQQLIEIAKAAPADAKDSKVQNDTEVATHALDILGQDDDIAKIPSLALFMGSLEKLEALLARTNKQRLAIQEIQSEYISRTDNLSVNIRNIGQQIWRFRNLVITEEISQVWDYHIPWFNTRIENMKSTWSSMQDLPKLLEYSREKNKDRKLLEEQLKQHDGLADNLLKARSVDAVKAAMDAYLQHQTLLKNEILNGFSQPTLKRILDQIGIPQADKLEVKKSIDSRLKLQQQVVESLQKLLKMYENIRDLAIKSAQLNDNWKPIIEKRRKYVAKELNLKRQIQALKEKDKQPEEGKTAQ